MSVPARGSDRARGPSLPDTVALPSPLSCGVWVAGFVADYLCGRAAVLGAGRGGEHFSATQPCGRRCGRTTTPPLRFPALGRRRRASRRERGGAPDSRARGGGAGRLARAGAEGAGGQEVGEVDSGASSSRQAKAEGRHVRKLRTTG